MWAATPVVDQEHEQTGAEFVLVEALLAQSETGLIALDPAMRVVLANGAALDLLGLDSCPAGASLARVFKDATALADSARETLLDWLAEPAGKEIILGRTDERSLSLRCSNGPDRHLLVALTLEPIAAAPYARRDALTGLPDRVWFFERLDRMIKEPGGQPAVLMIDLDRFKLVNDTLGHPVGDAVLQLVGKRLRSAVRDGDIVCRIAGDEFAMALRSPLEAEAVGHRVVTALSRPYLVQGVTTSIGASVGIALAPAHGNDPPALMRAADIALYAAKDSGRGATRVFDCHLERSARERHNMIEALRRAVPLKQLELFYQPQVAIDTGQLTGFEALVRWHHPELGMLLPDQFIPLAEETGLIWNTADWVLRTACEEAITWPMHLTVSVNISSMQLLDRNRLARTVKRILLKTALAPHRLELEITESALVREAETLPVLTTLREAGVRISLDDFGTGCSSLSQLRRFPLDKLKIDRSFIHALGSSGEAADLVRAIASLGRSLGITTIAEGVETEDQQQRLLVEGCIEMQGFILSRPVPAADVRALIATLPAKHPGAALAA